jgi:hypothetical protein
MPIVFVGLFLMAASLAMGIQLSLFAEAEQLVAVNPAQTALRVALAPLGHDSLVCFGSTGQRNTFVEYFCWTRTGSSGRCAASRSAGRITTGAGRSEGPAWLRSSTR